MHTSTRITVVHNGTSSKVPLNSWALLMDSRCGTTIVGLIAVLMRGKANCLSTSILETLNLINANYHGWPLFCQFLALISTILDGAAKLNIFSSIDFWNC